MLSFDTRDFTLVNTHVWQWRDQTIHQLGMLGLKEFVTVVSIFYNIFNWFV